MAKCLVTGSTGFVGRRLLSLLSTKEFDIRLLSRSEISNYQTIVCDFEKDRIPEDALESIDTVFHLAGFAHDMQDPSKVENLYQTINIDVTVELARLSVKSGVRKFVFISSVKAGGHLISGGCADESSLDDPEGLYGKSKREAELKLLKIGSDSGMQISIIRPSLVYGPGVKGNLQMMLSGIKSGWFPPLPKTENRRSMIHVDDLVQAILLVSEDERANGEIFNATDGKFYSSRDIYNAMCIAVGKAVPKWSIPKILFNLVSLASPRIKYKIKKILGDECYSSIKLEKLGFKAKKSLKDMNETDF